MTVPAFVPYTMHEGDGTTVTFTYNFKVFTSSDLEIYVDGVLQTETIQYTATGIGSDSGGSFTFFTAPNDGSSVLARSGVGYEQLLDLQPNQALPATSLEMRLDLIVIMIQQLLEELSRRPAFALDSLEALRDMVIPDFKDNALKLLQINATEDGLTLLNSALHTATPDSTSQLVFSQGVVEITPDAGDVMHEASSFVPAGVILIDVGAYVKTELGNANSLTTWSLGTLDEPTRFASGKARTAAAVTNSGEGGPIVLERTPSALDVYVTADSGSFDGTGVIVLTYSALSLTPLTTA